MTTRTAVVLVLVTAMLTGCHGSGASPLAESAPSSVTTPSVTTPSAAPAPTSTPTGRTTEQNRRAAARAAARVIRSVPLPHGTRRLRGEPPGWPDIYTVVNYNDPDAYQERWWSSVLPLRAVLEFYVDHHPPGMRHTPGEDPYSDGLGVGAAQGYTDFFPTSDAHWRQYSGPALVLEAVTVRDRTVIHGYTQTSARFVRNADTLATGEVTAIDVRRVRESLRNRRDEAVRHLAMPTDLREIRRLVRTFNHLVATTTVTSWQSCPPVDRLGYRVVFRTSDGRLVAGAADIYCGGEIQLTRNGKLLRTTLTRAAPGVTRKAPNRDWYGELNRVLRRS